MTPYASLIDPADYDRYDRLLADYLAGGVEEPRFVAERLLLGIYGQRQQDLCMVRTKLPGGRLLRDQLLGYAQALEQFSRAKVVHISTRQNIQFHHVPLARTAALQRHLGAAGIATREAGGNTVRNMTACPLAGVCPGERVDVRPLVEAATLYFVRNPRTQALPRKFKMSFSGCGADCAQAAVNDLGVVATEQDGRPGFQLWVGGGLGAKPHSPVLLDAFVPEPELLPRLEAVITLHDRHSDRDRKMRNRIKFLVDGFGAEGLRERYRREAARTCAAFDPQHAPSGDWRQPEPFPAASPDAPRAPLAQRQSGRHAVPVSVPHGDLSAAQLRGLHDLMTAEGLEALRALPDQNLLLTDVPAEAVARVAARLTACGLGLPVPGDRVVACPGTSTCTLGITASARLAKELSGGSCDLRVRVNGCQNSCAQTDLADIGLYGKGRRWFGRLVPTYALQLGGGGGVLGRDGPEVPAAHAPEAVQRLHDAYRDNRARGETFQAWSRRQPEGWFDALLADLAAVDEAEVERLAVDHGETGVFQVASVGSGECAGVRADPADKLALDLRYERRLRHAFVARRKLEEAAECLQAMLGLGFRGLTDSPELEQQGWQLVERLRAWRAAPDELAWPGLESAVEEWLGRINSGWCARAA